MQILNPNTPGVKVVEKTILPPSVVQVSTAVPVFVGYTKNGTLGNAVRITSLKEYEEKLGKGKIYSFTTTAAGSGYTATMPAVNFFLYEAIQLYFMNGGGPCYIISIGDTTSTISAAHFTDSDNGIPSIEKLDEPTLICFPEAVSLGATDYKTVVEAALSVCKNTKEKFALIDAPNGLDFTDLTVLTDYRTNALPSTDQSYGAAYYPPLQTVVRVAVDESNLGTVGSAEYTSKKNAVDAVNRLDVPPSALVAGVYAKVDREKGVWKAPANVALQGVIKPTIAISDADQNKLNVDENSGKSINAIREFTGKGTIIWGARTLDGNSNEWRYVNVRRLFIAVEESVKKAAAHFVFENNDAKTWSKVKAMISAYLNQLWSDGALMGVTAEEAYFVQVGMGTTMTQQDVLEGKMIVKIGLAAVRPAEFIILEFSHFVNQ